MLLATPATGLSSTVRWFHPSWILNGDDWFVVVKESLRYINRANVYLFMWVMGCRTQGTYCIYCQNELSERVAANSYHGRGMPRATSRDTLFNTTLRGIFVAVWISGVELPGSDLVVIITRPVPYTSRDDISLTLLVDIFVCVVPGLVEKRWRNMKLTNV